MYKFALIGCGEIAPRHAKAIRENGELMAVCDSEAERARSFTKANHCRSYTSIDDLLANEAEVNIISVCTPNGMHAEHVIKSLQAGKHVICEMPLCITSAAAWQIIETAKFSRRQVFQVQRLRENASLKELKNQIETGDTADIKFSMNCGVQDNGFFNGWRGKAFPGGGLLYSAFANYIDIVSMLFGEPSEITGIRNKTEGSILESEDTGSILLHFKNGIVGSIEWTIGGGKETKHATLEVTGSRVNYSLRGELLEERVLSGGDVLTLSENYHLEDPDPSYNNAYQRVVAALEQEENSNDLFEAMKTVTLIEKIYKEVPLQPSH